MPKNRQCTMFFLFFAFSFILFAQEKPLRVAVLSDFPPLYLLDHGRPSGLAIEILSEVARMSGFRVSYLPVQNWSEALDALRSGKADFIPGIGQETDVNDEFIASSTPMESVPVVVWLRKGTVGIQGPQDLPGHAVAVLKGGTAWSLLRTDPRIHLEVFPDADSAIVPLLSGAIDAFACPEPMLRSKLRQLSLQNRFMAVGEPLTEIRRVYLSTKERESFLRSRIDPALSELVRSKAYQRLYQKWYGEPEPLFSPRRVLVMVGAILGVLLLAFGTAWSVAMGRKNQELAKRLARQRAAERAMRESEEHYRTLFEKAPVGIATAILPDLSITGFNDAFASLFGYEPNEALSVAALHPEEELLRVSKTIEASRTGRPSVMESARCLRKDGSEFLCDIATTPITVGGKQGALGFFMDVSERERARAELRQNEKLSAIGQLAGGVAHDFNNQLAGIMGFTEILGSRLSARPEEKKLVDRIMISARRASELTGKLLAFARKGRYEEKTFDLREVVREAVAMAERTFDRAVSIELALPEERAPINGSSGQVQNAILNLLLNARDAMPEGGRIVITLDRIFSCTEETCSASPSGDPEAWYRLRIADDGVGMTKETLAHAFEPFFTTKPPGQGTGMGLASVYGTVKGHGGAVSVDSEPGRGTVVTLCFPAVTDDRLEAAEPSGRPDGSASTAASGTRKGRILLVDDEVDIRTSGALILSEAGYEVVTAKDGHEALDRFSADGAAFDAVILDIIMPGMNGRDAFSRMMELRSDARIVLSSGYSSDGTARALLDRGAMAFLQKPFSKSELLSAMAAVLK